MAKEWLDVADTAVKIGLGALITGIFTYLGIRSSQNSERTKFMMEHKVKLLEQISEDIETYFLALDSYVSRVAGITKIKKQSNKEGQDFSSTQKAALEEKNQELVAGWSNYKSAISKLRLIKAKKVVKEFSPISGLEKEIRDKIVFEKLVPKYDDVVDVRKRITVQKRRVHDALAELYSDL
ncbi:hypothetical protein ACPV54_25510 [Vibrio mediterranei]